MDNTIKRIIDIAKKTERTIIVGVFLTMSLLFFLGVVAREFPSNIANELSWIEEVVGVMNIFLVFLTLGLALEKGKHVKIPILLEKLGSTQSSILRRIIDIVGLLFTGYLCFISFELMSMVYHSGQRSPTLDYSMAVIYLAPAVGFFLIALRYFLSLIGMIDRFSEIKNNE
ncbi:TRAP transporter small permease [Vibrio litoralis]|uniref:TRAP transporter small permease n=1 Tax=Vibrio litoralis TaxID=335972 RepID=UPI00186922D1|nr:TRAP transporter small permease [Vibrio litoralis]